LRTSIERAVSGIEPQNTISDIQAADSWFREETQSAEDNV